MYAERIVVGLDYSATINEAVHWTRDYFAPHAEIILVHAVEREPPRSFIEDGTAAEARFAASLARAEDRVRGATRDLHVEGVCCRVRAGRPEDVLLGVAAEARADLIVIGPRGHLVRPWLRLGMVAEGMLRAMDRSVLLARGRMHDVPRRVLLALDDASNAPDVLGWVATIRQRFGSHVQALHVLSNAAAEAVTSRDAARAWLESSVKTAGLCDMVDIEVLQGSPADEILCAADRYQPDLLVLGRSGAGHAARCRGGRVVLSVAHGAQVPTLIVAET